MPDKVCVAWLTDDCVAGSGELVNAMAAVGVVASKGCALVWGTFVELLTVGVARGGKLIWLRLADTQTSMAQIDAQTTAKTARRFCLTNDRIPFSLSIITSVNPTGWLNSMSYSTMPNVTKITRLFIDALRGSSYNQV